MNCHETQRLMHGYLDGELDLSASLALESHLRDCECCRGLQRTQRALQKAIVRHGQYHAAPAMLKSRVLRRLDESGGRRAMPAWRWFPVAAVAVAALLFWMVTPYFGNTPSQLVAMSHKKVVFHITSSTDVATALRNLANHAEISPQTKVVVVAHNDGVDFLLRGAKDDDGTPYETAISQLTARGIDFRVCGTTLGRRHVDSGQVIPEAVVVPSGIAEISRLQTQEGYAYMRL